MKKNLKIILIIVILFLGGIAAFFGVKVAKTYFGGATGGSQPKNVSIQAEEDSATISWQTDKESLGVVEYGINQASLLLKKVETAATTTHRVVLSSLGADTTYYFRITVGEENYDNNGIPYSFQTKPAEEKVITPQATTALVKTCNAEEFKTKMGGSDPSYDFDHNGRVNTKDWLECLKVNK